MSSGSNNGGFRRGNMTLAFVRSASDEDLVGPAESEFGMQKSVRASEEITGEGIRGRAVYLFRNRASGAITGVRKIVYAADPRQGYYDAVRREASVYEALQEEQPDWREHILPFRRAIRHHSGIILDFDWVDGADLQTYFETATPREIKVALDHAARQLRWLALAGYHHGDVKADNIYRSIDGRVLLFDFDKANNHDSYMIRINERRKFMEMVGPHISERTRDLMTGIAAGASLADFYLTASRLIRKEYKEQRARTRRVPRRRTTSRQRSTRRQRH